MKNEKNQSGCTYLSRQQQKRIKAGTAQSGTKTLTCCNSSGCEGYKVDDCPGSPLKKCAELNFPDPTEACCGSADFIS
jgi:hypothetical protein